MNLKLVSLATALVLATVSLAPASFAAAATATVTTTTSTMAAKPAAKVVAKVATPDPKRFSTEAAAQATCATDTIVWANTKSKIFHLKGTSTYGKGKNGVYMCQADATTEGFKATKKPEKVTTAATTTTTTTTTTKSK